MGKGKSGREWLSIPAPTVNALKGWIGARGDAPGPLFVRLDRAGKGSATRLTGCALWKAVKARGEAAGLRRAVWPHALRHAGITAALDAVGDVRKVARFSRHADLRTVARYDDARRDFGGEVAAAVAATV
jgi:integrase/recombinase XerC